VCYPFHRRRPTYRCVLGHERELGVIVAALIGEPAQDSAGGIQITGKYQMADDDAARPVPHHPQNSLSRRHGVIRGIEKPRRKIAVQRFEIGQPDVDKTVQQFQRFRFFVS